MRVNCWHGWILFPDGSAKEAWKDCEILNNYYEIKYLSCSFFSPPLHRKAWEFLISFPHDGLSILINIRKYHRKVFPREKRDADERREQKKRELINGFLYLCYSYLKEEIRKQIYSYVFAHQKLIYSFSVTNVPVGRYAKNANVSSWRKLIPFSHVTRQT